MISEFLGLASCLMLADAQLQIQPHLYQSMIPNNVQPFQINSELMMTHQANSILNQDTSFPISPGVMVSGTPILVSQATQNILDQEPKIVGYNVPTQSFPQQQQHHQQHQLVTGFVQAPQLIPIFQTGYNANSAAGQQTIQLQGQPQTITFPVLNIAQQEQQQQQPLNVVPVQAVASLKSVLEKSKLKESSSFTKTKFRTPSTENRYKSGYRRPIISSTTPRPQSSQVYHDISSDHPLPVPLVHKKVPSSYHQKARNHFQERPKISDFAASNREKETEISYMRPPPLSSDHQRAPSQQISTHHEIFERQNYNSPRNHQSNGKENYSSDHDELLKVKKSQRDSSSQSSESYYQQAPSRTHDNYNEQLSYGGYSAPSQGGYSSSDTGAVVHKHIFVHAAPETYEDQRPRVKVVRPAPNEKHVQVIFVKSPAPPPQEQTIVELPENPPMKTVVYVLAKNQDRANDVKVVRPPPTKPPAPEIYFIRYGQRYGDKNNNQGYPVQNLQSLYDNYGAFSQPAETPIRSGSPLRSKRNHDGLGIYAPLMAYSTSGQINEITKEEAEFRRTNVDSYF